MQNSGIAEAQFRQSASTGPLFLLVCWSAFISVVRWALDQRTKTAFCPPLPRYKFLNGLYLDPETTKSATLVPGLQEEYFAEMIREAAMDLEIPGLTRWIYLGRIRNVQLQNLSQISRHESIAVLIRKAVQRGMALSQLRNSGNILYRQDFCFPQL